MRRNAVATCLGLAMLEARLLALVYLLVVVGLMGLLGPVETADGEPRDPTALEQIGGIVLIPFGFAVWAILNGMIRARGMDGRIVEARGDDHDPPNGAG